MSGERRLPLNQAERLAEELLELLRPACERIAVAGSIRRRKADIGDIELVAVPKDEEALDLFGGRVSVSFDQDQLTDRVCGLLVDNIMAPRKDANGRIRFGSRYKALLYQGVAVDLFSVMDPAQWGVIFLLRTGPADFSRRFVTPRRQGGMLPEWAVVKDGAIWHRSTGKVIETPEEDDVWKLLGIEPIPPEARRWLAR